MEYFNTYFNRIHKACQTIDQPFLDAVQHIITRVKKEDKKIIIAGNGGSAALASHVSVDFTKTAGIRSTTFSDADLITCFANDFGYEQWLAAAIEYYAHPGDAIILVSSSGTSPNMIEAAKTSLAMELDLITFSGFSSDNPLRTYGHANAWVDSKEYNIVEMTHHIWLLAIMDNHITLQSS